ncbi:MAG: hypothetical protein JOZ15_15080, partial [Acidobacteria bacterium]|nr:hypothetical protein [Acidobacteriota bacterium]
GASPDLLFRSKDPFDGAQPATNAVAVLNLIELAERDAAGRRAHWRDQATAALKAFAPLVEQHPEAVRMLAIGARRYHGGVPAPVEAGRERMPEAGALAMLEKEAEQLVTVHLELGVESETEAAGAEHAGGAGAAGGAETEAGWRPFRLVLEIAPGWHLQANPPSESFLVPTTLAAEGAELRRVAYPAGDPLPVAFSSRPVASYQGRVELTGEIGVPADRRRPQAEGARLLLTYQLCDDRRCLPPVTRTVQVSWESS